MANPWEEQPEDFDEEQEEEKEPMGKVDPVDLFGAAGSDSAVAMGSGSAGPAPSFSSSSTADTWDTQPPSSDTEQSSDSQYQPMINPGGGPPRPGHPRPPPPQPPMRGHRPPQPNYDWMDHYPAIDNPQQAQLNLARARLRPPAGEYRPRAGARYIPPPRQPRNERLQDDIHIARMGLRSPGQRRHPGPQRPVTQMDQFNQQVRTQRGQLRPRGQHHGQSGSGGSGGSPGGRGGSGGSAGERGY